MPRMILGSEAPTTMALHPTITQRIMKALGVLNGSRSRPDTPSRPQEARLRRTGAPRAFGSTSATTTSAGVVGRNQVHIDIGRGFGELHHHHGSRPLRLQILDRRNQPRAAESRRAARIRELLIASSTDQLGVAPVHIMWRLTASWFGNILCARLWLTMTTCSPPLRSASLKSRPAISGMPSDAKNPDETARTRPRGSSSPAART